MSDVSALIGKLKANVAYRRFNAPATDSGQSWPVLERIAQAQRGEGPEAAATPDAAEQPEAQALQPPVAPSPVIQPTIQAAPQPVAQPEAAAATQASTSPLLRRIQAAPAQAAPAPVAQPEPPTFSALASAAAPPMNTAPEPILPPQPALQVDVQPEPEPARGSLFQRYAPAVEPEPEPQPEPQSDPAALTSIFARLERKSR